MRSSAVLVAFVLAAVTVLAGCGGGEQGTGPTATDPVAVEEAARQEGQLRWLAAGTQVAADKIAAAFTEQYGIVVTVERYSSADMAQRVQGDVRSLGRLDTDVTTQTDNALALSLEEQQLIAPLTAADFPGLPPNLMYEQIGPIVQFAVPVIGYSTQQLAGFTPKTWADLLDPRLKGVLMVTDPRSAATWAQIWNGILQNPALGEDYVRSIAAQDFQPVASSLVGAEQLAAGQGAALIASTPSVFDAQIAKGAPIAYVSPSDPAPVAYTSVSVAEGAAHPNAARLFATWLTSEKGSQVMNATEGTASPLGSFPDTFPLPPGVSTTPPDPEEVRAAGVRAAELLGLN